MDNVVSVL